jgi:hypothetical protein
MNPLHPELRTGLAEERIRRLADDRRAPFAPGPTRRLFARVLLSAGARLAGERARPAQASSASLTSVSAS